MHSSVLYKPEQFNFSCIYVRTLIKIKRYILKLKNHPIIAEIIENIVGSIYKHREQWRFIRIINAIIPRVGF